MEAARSPKMLVPSYQCTRCHILRDVNIQSQRRKNLMSHVKNETEFFERKRSRDGAIGIATSYGLDDKGVGTRVPLW
jgi:hypothetical protein